MSKEKRNIYAESLLDPRIEGYLSNLSTTERSRLAKISPSFNNLENESIKRKYSDKAADKPFRGKLQCTIEAPMDSECKVCINIPVHSFERNLMRTLEQYANQIDENRERISSHVFEISLLVNNHEGQPLNEAYFYDLVRRFQLKYPDIKINLNFYSYNSSQATISTIRRDQASLSLFRADQSKVDIDSLAFVTNDADAIAIDPQYISRIIKGFDQNKRLKIQVGTLDYPREDYFSNHLLLAMNRFIQYFELILRYKSDRVSMRGGNSSIRASTYLEAGGHVPAKLKRENLPLYNYVRDTYGLEAIKVDPVMRITTNARRALIALEMGALAKQHADFGKEGDHAERYLVPEEQLSLPSNDIKVTNERFDELLAEQITVLYNKFISDFSYIKRYPISEAEVRIRFLEAVNNLNLQFQKAADYLGVQIKFIPREQVGYYDIQVVDISKLRSRIIKKYNYI